MLDLFLNQFFGFFFIVYCKLSIHFRIFHESTKAQIQVKKKNIISIES